MGTNFGQVKAQIEAQFTPGWVVFSDGEYSVVSIAAIALADFFVTGGAISIDQAQREAAKFGVNLAEKLAANGFDSNDTIYGGIMTFQNWQDTPLGPIPLPNKFKPYVAVRRHSGGVGGGGDDDVPRDRVISYTLRNDSRYDVELDFTPTGNEARLRRGGTTNCRSPVRNGVFPKVRATAPNGAWWERTIRTDNGNYQIVNRGDSGVQIVP